MTNILQAFNVREIYKLTFIFFVVIDVIGCIPYFLKAKRVAGRLEPMKVFLVATTLGVAFLFTGQKLLEMCDLTLTAFRAGGGLILLVLGVELLFDLNINKLEIKEGYSPSVTPLGFPLITGTGTLTTLLVLQDHYAIVNILIAFLINMGIIYLVVRFIGLVEKVLRPIIVRLLSKLIGLMLVAMAIQLIKEGFTK